MLHESVYFDTSRISKNTLLCINYNIVERYMFKVTCRPNAAGVEIPGMFYMYVIFVHNTCHNNKNQLQIIDSK